MTKIDGCIGCHTAPAACLGPDLCKLRQVAEVLACVVGEEWTDDSVHTVAEKINSIYS